MWSKRPSITARVMSRAREVIAMDRVRPGRLVDQAIAGRHAVQPVHLLVPADALNSRSAAPRPPAPMACGGQAQTIAQLGDRLARRVRLGRLVRQPGDAHDASVAPLRPADGMHVARLTLRCDRCRVRRRWCVHYRRRPGSAASQRSRDAASYRRTKVRKSGSATGLSPWISNVSSDQFTLPASTSYSHAPTRPS